MNDREKIQVIKSRLDSCNDICKIDKYIDIILSSYRLYPSDGLKELLEYAKKRRQNVINFTIMAVIDPENV